MKNRKPVGTGGKDGERDTEKGWAKGRDDKGKQREKGEHRAPRQGRKQVSEDETPHLMTIFWRKARGPEPGRGSGGGGPGPRAEAAGGSPWAVMYFL